MNRNLRNQLRPALLATALVTAIVVVVLWSAASTRTSLADEAPVRSSIESLAQTPTSQTWSPERDAIITQKDPLTISGYAWESGVTPPFLTEDPMLSIQRVNERSYYVGWTAVLSAEHYILQEAITPDFSVYTSTLVPHPTTNELITKGTQDDDTYYYRVQATRFGLGPSRWSNVASVVVPWTLTSSDLAPSTPSASLATNGTLTVEVRIDDGEWHTATVIDAGWTGGGGWSWSYIWSPLPEENNIQHRIETRATDAVGSVSPVDAITVTLNNKSYFFYMPLIARRWPPIPYTPTLNDINNPTKADNYTVSWSYDPGSPPVNVSSFTLQEARDASFTDPTEYSTGGTSQSISGKTSGTYYYRVRGVNSYGPGEWSNVVSTQVETGFFDNFSSTSTGWPEATYNRGTSPDGPVMRTKYTDGTYRVKILLDNVGLNNKRMGIVPSPWVNPYSNYDVEVDHYFIRALDQYVDPTWGKAGLVFGAENDFSTVFVVEWHFPLGSNAPQCAVYKYNNVTLPTSIVWTAGGTPLRGWASCPGLKGGYNQTNRIRVEVRGTKADVYINTTKLGTFSDLDLGRYHRVGLMTGSWDRTPVESRFDNFRVTSR